MQKLEYARMEHRERNYWWHVGRLRIIHTYMEIACKGKKKTSIMNIGCGTGGTIDTLSKFGTVDNVDVSDDAIGFMKANGYGRITKVDDIQLPFKDGKYDVVGAFDVLEHIEDHVGALKEWARVIKDDGAIVVTVPAYQWLWSDHDTSLHHKRRFTTHTLTAAAKQAGLRPEKKSHAIVFSLPLVVSFRFLNKLLRRKTDSETSYVDMPTWLNTLFTKLLYIEAKFHRTSNFPMGTSVVAIFRKENA